MVREGLVAPWWKKGSRGQPLADGRMCWRHRAKLTEKRVREAGDR